MNTEPDWKTSNGWFELFPSWLVRWIAQQVNWMAGFPVFSNFYIYWVVAISYQLSTDEWIWPKILGWWSWGCHILHGAFLRGVIDPGSTLAGWKAVQPLRHSCWSNKYRIETYWSHHWLVVWNMNFMTFHILGIIIPTDFHIFLKGRYTTKQIKCTNGQSMTRWWRGHLL